MHPTASPIAFIQLPIALESVPVDHPAFRVLLQQSVPEPARFHAALQFALLPPRRAPCGQRRLRVRTPGEGGAGKDGRVGC